MWFHGSEFWTEFRAAERRSRWLPDLVGCVYGAVGLLLLLWSEVWGGTADSLTIEAGANGFKLGTSSAAVIMCALSVVLFYVTRTPVIWKRVLDTEAGKRHEEEAPVLREEPAEFDHSEVSRKIDEFLANRTYKERETILNRVLAELDTPPRT